MWTELTTVTTPRCEELGKDILIRIVVQGIPSVGDKGVNRTVVTGRDSSRLDASWDITSDVLLHKSRNGVCADGTGHWVLGLLGEILDNKSGPRVSGEVEGFSVVNKLDGIDPNEVDLALELFGDRRELFDELFVGRGVLWVDEEVGNGETLGGVSAKVLRSDLVKEGDRVALDKLFELIRVDAGDRLGGKNGVSLIERLVKNNGGQGWRAWDRWKRGSGVLTKHVGVSGIVSVVKVSLGDWVIIVTVGHKNAEN